MRGHKVELGFEHAGRSYTVQWRYVLRDSTGHPAMWVERVVDDETQESRPDLIREAEADAEMGNDVVNVVCEAEAAARDDAEQNRVDAYLDERRGLL